MGRKILLVEDETPIRELYKRELDLAGFETDAFATGRDGLTALKAAQYDLVLLDIMLPDLNGLEVLQQMKQDEQTKSVPVVFLTNLGQDTIIQKGFGLGAEGYLIKAALTPDQIVQEVKSIFEGKDKS